MRRLFVLLVAGALMFTSASVSAAPSSVTVTKATGSVSLDANQFIDFSAFEVHDAAVTSPNPDEVKGEVSYTNYGVPTVGTGMWVPAGTFGLGFAWPPDYPGPFTHTMTITSFQKLSSTVVSFTAEGYYADHVPADPRWTWVATGTIEGDHIMFTIVPDAVAPYGWTWLNVMGTIGAGGVMSGTALDSLGRSLTWTADSDFYEVWHYSVPVLASDIGAPTANVGRFAYTIPAWMPGAGGYGIVFSVQDNGAPGKGTADKIGFVALAPGADMTAYVNGTSPIAMYDVFSGNLTVK